MTLLNQAEAEEVAMRTMFREYDSVMQESAIREIAAALNAAEKRGKIAGLREAIQIAQECDDDGRIMHGIRVRAMELEQK